MVTSFDVRGTLGERLRRFLQVGNQLELQVTPNVVPTIDMIDCTKQFDIVSLEFSKENDGSDWYVRGQNNSIFDLEVYVLDAYFISASIVQVFIGKRPDLSVHNVLADTSAHLMIAAPDPAVNPYVQYFERRVIIPSGFEFFFAVDSEPTLSGSYVNIFCNKLPTMEK